VPEDPNLTLTVSGDAGYRQSRRNLTALLRDRPEAGSLRVPACPEWSVRDALEHLTGICRSVESRLPGGVAGPASLGRMDAAQLIAEWNRSGERVDRLLAGRPGPSVMVMDAFTHELDITLALGAPPPAEHPSYQDAEEVVYGGFSGSVAAHGLPALRVETDGSAWIAGMGRPAAVVSGSRFDIYRSMAGRRTPAQIAALDWSRDPAPWLRAFAWGPFSPPRTPVE